MMRMQTRLRELRLQRLTNAWLRRVLLLPPELALRPLAEARL